MATLTKYVSLISAVAVFALGLFGQPALAQLQPGVTQSAAHTANITGTVARSDGSPIAGAAVKLYGPAVLATKSDVHGVFNFRGVPWGTYQIVVSSELGTASRSNVVVNADINVAIQYEAVQAGLRTIAHVSTSGAGAHINITSSSISSISPSEYAFQGNATWNNLFSQIPGVAVSGFSGVAGAGSLDGLQAVPGSPHSPAVLLLNGALPYETSTTLDGMPLEGDSPSTETNAGGGVDLSNFPMNAFTTADVVRGPGANAPSIVDSIGGSFVLHAPGQVDVNHFEYSVSNDAYGGIVSNAEIALHLGKLSATLTYGVNDSPGPLGTSTGISGFSFTPTTINGEHVWAATYSEPANAYGIPNCHCTLTDTLLYSGVQQSTAWIEHNGAVALSYAITPAIVAEVFYTGGTSTEANQEGYLPVEFSPSAAASPAYSGSLPASPPGEPTYTNLPGVVFPGLLYTEASRLLEEKITAYFWGGVLRLAALQHQTYVNVGFGPFEHPENGEYTLWGTAKVGPTLGTSTETAYNGTLANLTFSTLGFKLRTYPSNRDLLGSYELQVGSASTVGVSFVTSYYNTAFNTFLYLGTTPIFNNTKVPAISETTNETRVHYDAQVSDKLSLGLSWYFTEGTFHVPLPSNANYWTNVTFPYNAPRFGAVWLASPDIAVRASAGGGFALPQLYNLTGLGITPFTGYYVSEEANLNLKPEESFGVDIGTDLRLHHDTVLSLDLYRTNLYGQFFETETTGTFMGEPLYTFSYGNVATSRYEGLNLDVHHDVTSGYYWRGTFGLTRGYVVSVPPGFYNNPSVPCTNCVNQYIIPGANFNAAAFSGTVPYASGSAMLGYRWRPGTYFDLSSTYYGNNNIYLTPHAFIELDGHASYAITRNVSLLATFRNITGVYDQSVQTYIPSYEVPVIPGAPPYSQGAALELPFGPRAVIVTADFRY